MDRKNNHYVPVFHLKKWSTTNKPTIMLYNIKKQIYNKDVSYNDQASKKFLYGHDDKFEEYMTTVENLAGPIIKKIIEEKTLNNLSKDDIMVLYFYILISDARTLKKSDEENSIMNEIIQPILKMEQENTKQGLCNIPSNNIEKYKAVKLENANLLPVTTAAQFYEIITDMKCILLHNKTKKEFLTSDCPVIIYNLFYIKNNYSSGWGMTNHGVIIIVPINPFFAIMIYDQFLYKCSTEKKFTVTIYEEKDIDEINKLMIANCYNCVYGTSNVPENYIEHLIKRSNKRNDIMLNTILEKSDGNKYVSLIKRNRQKIIYKAFFKFLKINEENEQILQSLPSHNMKRPFAEKKYNELSIFWDNEERMLKEKLKNRDKKDQ